MTGGRAPFPDDPPLGDEEARELFLPLLSPFLAASAETPGPSLLLAVSGGPDSTALLGLAAAVLPRDALAVASVDHRLRGEGAREVEAVAAFAARLGLPCHRLSWDGPKPATGRAQAARAVRRALLAELAARIGARAVAMAHHADDQAETLLLRLSAGSGPSGLAGMRPVAPLAPGLALLRPFLPVSKARLVATCRARGWPFATDPSNADPGAARTRARRTLRLLEPDGISTARVARLAARMARLDDAVDAAVDEAMRRLVRREGGRAFRLDAAVRDCPAELRLRLLARLLAEAGETPRPDGAVGVAPSTPLGPRLGRLEALADRLDEARSRARPLAATLAGCAVRLDAEGALTVAPAPPRRAGSGAKGRRGRAAAALDRPETRHL